jgi:tetratricopeptide (TPR) repeat protein
VAPAVERMRRVLALGFCCGIWVGATGCSQSFGDRLNQVRELHAQGRYEGSLEMLRSLMDENPTDPEVNYRFGKSLMEAGEPSLAIWPLQRAAEYPQYAFEASMLLAQATLDSRAPEAAIAAVDVALAIEPDNVEALALRAHASLTAGRDVDALADVERAAALEPGNPALWIPRILALLAFDRFDEAEAVLKTGQHAAELGEEPASERIQARLCLANAGFAVDDGDEKSAEVIYADCLDAYPMDSHVVLSSVGFYDAIGEPERATALLRRTFEETRMKDFGYALSRRMRRLREGARRDPPATASHEKRSSGRV